VNLRISENQLRFRITRDELDFLMNGEILQLDLNLSTQRLVYSISTSDSAAPLALIAGQNLLHLAVNKVTLTEFASNLPAREGIEHEVQLGMSHVTLMLEVDVRRKR